MDMETPPDIEYATEMLSRVFRAGAPAGHLKYLHLLDPLTLQMLRSGGHPVPEDLGRGRLPPHVAAARKSLGALFEEAARLHGTSPADREEEEELEEAFMELRDDLIAWWADNVDRDAARRFAAARPTRAPGLGTPPPTPERERRMRAALGERLLRAYVAALLG